MVFSRKTIKTKGGKLMSRKDPALHLTRAALSLQISQRPNRAAYGKWRKTALKIASFVIILCFLLANDQYRVRAAVKNHKDLISDKKKVVNYWDAVKNQRPDLARARGLISKVLGFNRGGYYVGTKKPMLSLLAGGDTCGTAATAITATPYNDAAGTTVGKTDNYDLPPDVTAPTLTGCPTCVGTGAPAGRGFVYTGTGTGPDATYSIGYSTSNNNISVTMDPVSQDLAVIVYTSVCSNNLADGIVIDDTGGPGTAESVTITNMPAGFYHIVVDGYSTGGVPPGPSDAYTLAVTGTNPSGPTAAIVTVSGRVVTADGRGIGKVSVVLSDLNGQQPRFALTNPFGYFSFYDIEVGNNYVFSVSSKRYQFDTPSQIIMVNDEMDNVTFTAQPLK
jgi:hypothetical protein